MRVNQHYQEKAKAVVQFVLGDPKLARLYAQADEMSSAQTKHDIAHAIAVHGFAMSLTAEYESLFPQRLDVWTRDVVIPLAAFLHDIGRCIDIGNHAVAGAAIANVYLRRQRLPLPIIGRICRIIALHRSERVLKMQFDDPAWAIVVIADKCVGDEDRVRRRQANILRALRLVGLARHNWWSNAQHHRANFAIKQAQIAVEVEEKNADKNSSPAAAIVLKIVLDEKVSAAQEVTALFADRYQACSRAAQYLGLVFRLEFNRWRYVYDDRQHAWIPAL